MVEMGQIFKELRTARKISLKEAAGQALSYSMLSKFENGDSDITISKLLPALDNIHTDLAEFAYLVRGFQPSQRHLLKQEIWRALEKKDFAYLQKGYEREKATYQETGQEANLLNALTFKTYLATNSVSVELTEDEQAFLYDYLFRVDIWGEYELAIFTDISPLLPLESYFRYTREMLQRIDFFEGLNSHRNAIHTILLNGLFKAVEQKDLIKAAYFDKQIKIRFFEENEAYLRLIYRIADGHHTYLRGEKEAGREKIRSSIEILRLLGCRSSADYYQENFADVLKAFE
ncbi:Rgg/GadR/MutR family transcriptional regulator [Streptococcus cuniculipharyngis]|uniref:Helix-turn-helix domain-containing protein n=1 Tax=Streptococcus cuniculipharyngis TaxID=1562651 RepID=A0A5C5SH44_9STRE|nr:Rgg/GadR/MutR family transcriptional regulator [Streptococcus cuniculipharyngis]TWS99241.1 helix-turn-helix domain-containing protein [Streptococcus cuniculipharyngis]